MRNPAGVQMGTRMEVRMGTETKSEVKYRVVKEEPLDGVYVASRAVSYTHLRAHETGSYLV